MMNYPGKYKKHNSWQAQRKHTSRSKASPLSDTPTVLPERMEAIEDHLRGCMRDDGKYPPYPSLNKRHGIRGSKLFWDNLKGRL